MPTLMPFQEFVDRQPDHLRVALIPEEHQGSVRWFHAPRERQRVAVRAEEWNRVPPDCWATAVRREGRVYLLAISDDRVVTVLPAVGAIGAKTMPHV